MKKKALCLLSVTAIIIPNQEELAELDDKGKRDNQSQRDYTPPKGWGVQNPSPQKKDGMVAGGHGQT